MTSPISPISGFSGVSGIEGITAGGTDALQGSTALPGSITLPGAAGTGAVEGPNENFASMLSRGLESVQSMQGKAEGLAVKVADGTLQDPAQYTMAANEAALGLQLTLAVRNKALDAFQEIMRMQA